MKALRRWSRDAELPAWTAPCPRTPLTPLTLVTKPPVLLSPEVKTLRAVREDPQGNPESPENIRSQENLERVVIEDKKAAEVAVVVTEELNTSSLVNTTEIEIKRRVVIEVAQEVIEMRVDLREAAEEASEEATEAVEVLSEVEY